MYKVFQAPSPLQGKKLTLTYFPLPALGEPLRLLLELGGFDWTDNQVVQGGIELFGSKLRHLLHLPCCSEEESRYISLGALYYTLAGSEHAHLAFVNASFH